MRRLVVSGFVLIWNEGHVWMPQSWKQGQVRLILNNDKPRTIGDAQHITIHNAHHNMHTHMLAWWLRDSMTTLCLASQCAFIASRHIRNTIVLVNSLIDANTDGVIMMLDWAKASDSVDHEHLENVLFLHAMGLDWTAETDEHSKGLHTACNWKHIERGSHWRASRVSTMTSNAVFFSFTIKFVGFCQ